MIAIATGMGVGMNALLSRSLGEKNAEEAGQAARNGAYLYALSWLLFVVLGLFFSRIFFAMQTDIPEILEGDTVYIRICTITSFGVFGQIFCERLLQSTGCAVLSMLTQGVGAVINIILDPIMIFGMNRILMAFTATATAVFGIYFKLKSFVFMPVFGLNNGMVPIISFSYGARNRARIMEKIRLSVTYAVSIMLLSLVIIQLFPGQLLMMFDASENMLDIGIGALRVISLSFVLVGFGVTASSVFQALGNAVYSLLASLVRQLVVILPMAWLLGRLGGLSAVWWAFPVAELFSVAMCAMFLRRILQEKVELL